MNFLPAAAVGPAWVWAFVVFMTLYNAVKYPLIAAATKANPYRISSILGGKVEASSPRWFLLLHVPLMVASNLLASGIGFGFQNWHLNPHLHMACVALETANLVILLPPSVHQHLGSGKGLQPTVLNLGTAIPMVALMWASVYGAADARWGYFWFGYALKCIGIFGAEMAALAVGGKAPAPTPAAAKAD